MIRIEDSSVWIRELLVGVLSKKHCHAEKYYTVEAVVWSEICHILSVLSDELTVLFIRK